MSDNSDNAPVTRRELHEELATSERRIINVLNEIKESLERQLAKLDRRFDEVNGRFDVQAARLERHAALLQTGCATWEFGYKTYRQDG